MAAAKAWALGWLPHVGRDRGKIQNSNILNALMDMLLRAGLIVRGTLPRHHRSFLTP